MAKAQFAGKPPDGGCRGWMVVIGTFFIHVVVVGSAKSFGVFYAEFREVFQESAGTTSFISSILGGVLLMCSPFAGALSNLTSCRSVIIAGGVISAVGLVVSFFARTMVHLFFSVGILTGWLYDATGNYDWSFFSAAIFIFASVLVLLLNPCSTTRRTLGPGTGQLPEQCDGVVVLSHMPRAGYQ